MEKSIRDFQAKHEFMAAIDSDGCVFDVMEIKHKECFCPSMINIWDLQPVSRYAREEWEFVNLYSSWRGVNRFLTLVKVLDRLGEREEVKRLTDFRMPPYASLKRWVLSGEPLNNLSLKNHQDDPELKRTLEWSLDCNRRIAEMVHGVPPFPYTRECIRKLSEKADIIIVSGTASEALYREWKENALIGYVSAVCGQEDGNKKECIAKVKDRYSADHCLMIGDAPGDYSAAEANGILFYPIRPQQETDSWQELNEQYLDSFFSDQYRGNAEAAQVEKFSSLLPECV